MRYFVSVGYFTQTGMFETDVDKIKEHETIQALLAASPDVAKGLYKEGYDSEYRYNRLTTRSNIDINLTEDFKVSVNLSYRFEARIVPTVMMPMETKHYGYLVCSTVILLKHSQS